MLCCFLGCSPAAPLEWQPPAMAEQDANEPLDTRERGDFEFIITLASREGAPFEGKFYNYEFSLSENWITYVVATDYATGPAHARLMLTQDLVYLTGTASEAVGAEPGSMRVNVADVNYNWIAGTNPDGEVAVKP